MNYYAPNLPYSKHRFFTKRGGVSQGKYKALNASINSQDSNENIFNNLNLAAGYFGKTLKDLNILTQGISNQAIYISSPQQFMQKADGAVTDKSGIILALRTADCAPILFYDNHNEVIGVAHAGWRGALYGIIENTLDLMISRGAEKNKIAAAIGPCLQKKSFECQADMRQQFINIDPKYQRFFRKKDSKHWLFDAEKFCIHRLRKYGIQDICTSGIDTYNDSDYFSYRRSCHKHEVTVPLDFPSHLSTIML